MRCNLCKGYNFVYRIGISNTYSVTNMGGKKIKCPECTESDINKKKEALSKIDSINEQIEETEKSLNEIKMPKKRGRKPKNE